MADQQEIQQRLKRVIERAQAGEPEAQYALGIVLSRQRQTVEQAYAWLARAAEAGHAGATFTLGAWHIQGMLVPADYEKGHRLLEQASRLGFGDADTVRAALYATGIGVGKSWEKAIGLVIGSAKAGHPRALTQLGFLCRMTGDEKAAAQADLLLQAAADTYDPAALYAVARRTLAGKPSPEEEARAKTDLAIAGKLGLHPLAAAEPGIETAGIPQPLPPRNPDLAKVEWSVVERALPAPPLPPQAGRKVLSESPLIALYPGFFSHEECDYLVALAHPLLRPSQVTDPMSGEAVHLDYRTSSDMRFWHVYQDLVIHSLNQRIARAAGEPPEHQEMLGILRYQPGEQYKPHSDFVTVEKGVLNREVERSGQRVKTFLGYLNEGYEGGETEFVKLGIRARGRKGDGLLFQNVDAKGEPDERTLHAGLPITKGVKWLSTIWIRARPYRFRDEG